MVYLLTYFFTKVISFFIFPRRVYGMNYIPKTGAFVFASNHISNIDPPLLGISTTRRLHYMAKIELFKHPFMNWWLRKLWAFPVKRGEGDLGAIKHALMLLKKGEPVLLFPEGTRRLSVDEPLKPQPGTGFLVLKAKVPVVPVFIDGTDKVMPPGSKGIKRAPVTVYIGESFTLDPNLSNEQASLVILERIYALKPAK